jgi:hypothetical protein
MTDAGTSDASDACDTSSEAGLEVTLDLSALGTTAAGTTLHPATAIVLDDTGAEVGRGEASFVLPDLPAGTYSVVFERVELAPSGTMAGAAYGLLDGTVRRAQVVACERTRVEGRYQPLPSAGRLWVSSGEALAGFTEAELAGGTDVEADALLSVRLVNDFRGFAFDRLGNLWAGVAPTYGSRLMWFAPEQLTGRSQIEPKGEIHARVFDDFAPISDVIFDADGSLRVAVRRADNSFAGFAIWTRAQLVDALERGGVVEMEPSEVVALEGFGGRVDLEVSPSGALWVAAYDDDTLLRIDDPLTWAGPAPDASFTVVSSAPGAAQQTGPENIAFTDDGDAVAVFWGSGAVMELSAADLARSGAVELSVMLDPFFVDQLPQGLVIDGTGRVLIGNYAGNGTGNVLGWTPGTMPEALASSPDVVDPTDLLLDPRPR